MSLRIIPYSAQLLLPVLFLLVIKVLYFLDILVILVPVSFATQVPADPEVVHASTTGHHILLAGSALSPLYSLQHIWSQDGDF